MSCFIREYSQYKTCLCKFIPVLQFSLHQGIFRNCRIHRPVTQIISRSLPLNKLLRLKSYHICTVFLWCHPHVVRSCVCGCTGRKEPLWHWGYLSAPGPKHDPAHGPQPGRGPHLRQRQRYPNLRKVVPKIRQTLQVITKILIYTTLTM